MLVLFLTQPILIILPKYTLEMAFVNIVSKLQMFPFQPDLKSNLYLLVKPQQMHFLLFFT